MNLKKKLGRYWRVNLLGPDPCLMKKRIYRAAVSQRLRNTAQDGPYGGCLWRTPSATFHLIPLSHYFATYTYVFEKIVPLGFIPKICVVARFLFDRSF